jgi:hypothetical protein
MPARCTKVLFGNTDGLFLLISRAKRINRRDDRLWRNSISLQRIITIMPINQIWVPGLLMRVISHGNLKTFSKIAARIPRFQSYFNDNSKMSDSLLGVSTNQPQAYVRTMDDDAGTMSSWFVMRIGLSSSNAIYFI